MSDFYWSPDPGANLDTEFKLRVAKFGDGYQQRAPDGINNVDDKWSLTFTRTADVIDQIHQFLLGKKNGESFTFTPPRGTEVRVICSKFSRTFSDRSTNRLTLTLERVYE